MTKVTDSQRPIIPPVWDVAAQVEIWETLKRLAPRAYEQVTLDYERRVGER